MMAMTIELQPCPFCGKEGPFDQWPCEWLDGKGENAVRCPYCHGAAPMATWNRRAHLTQPAQAVDDGMLPDALVPHAKEWYRLCERRFSVDRMTISGELAEAIVKAISQPRALAAEKAG